jgi:carbonic anhydrase
VTEASGASAGVRPTVPEAPSIRRAERASAANASGGESTVWGYGLRNGPAQWARLDPGYALCGSGARQSPIDIVDPVSVEMEPIRFNYAPVRYRIANLDHTLQVDVEPGGEALLMGNRYQLQAIRFHRPGEIRIRGRAAEMAVHLIHLDKSGRQAIVAVNLERGAALPVLEQLWGDIPLDRGPARLSSRALDPSVFLPASLRHYVFSGSLTTPPCTEDVLWIHMIQAKTLSAAQFTVFTQLYPVNARSVQPLNGRLIREAE